ncbi:MAG: SLATT domain-containing protein [Pseudomonadales bacterium]
MKDNVWWTRKARIHAESRLLSNQHYLDLLLLWYSLTAVFVSIWLLGYGGDQQLSSVVFTCFSVFILTVSLFGANARFTQRAAQFKENYISLQELYFQINNSSATSETTFQKEYRKLLELTENHIEIDDIRALVWEWYNAKKKSEVSREPKSYHYFKYVIYLTKRWIFFSILFFLPLVLGYISIIGYQCPQP